MTKKVRLKVVLTHEYDATVDYYKDGDKDPTPEEMAAIDQENWAQDHGSLMESLMDGDYTVEVLPA